MKIALLLQRPDAKEFAEGVAEILCLPVFNLLDFAQKELDKMGLQDPTLDTVVRLSEAISEGIEGMQYPVLVYGIQSNTQAKYLRTMGFKVITITRKDKVENIVDYIEFSLVD